MGQAMAGTAPPDGGTAPGWGQALIALAIGLAGLGAVFFREGAAAIGVWEASTAYNHCWLVLPVAGWLAWSRRDRLAGLGPRPEPWLALLALPPALAWFAAERLGIMEGRQLAVIGMVWALALAVLGRAVCRAMAAPLLYLVFLVPFGAFATPLLQRITAKIIEAGLSAWGISHYVDDLVIEIPEGTFLVAEACAGLRFLIAALAFGALYAALMFRSPGRRLIVMALAVGVPILANGLRALGIVVLGHYLGSAEAAAADHVLYGWVFFSVVILLLILLGLPFREDLPAEAGAAPPRRGTGDRGGRRGAAATVAGATAALAVAAAGPALAAAMDGPGGGAAAPEAVPMDLAVPEGCMAGDVPGTLRCGAALASARALRFPARATWAAVAAAQRTIAGPPGEDDHAFSVAGPGGVTWRARQPRQDGAAASGTALWIGGRPAGGGLRNRAELALASLRGGGSGPVLAVVTVEGAAARSTLRAVLEAQPGPRL